MPEIRVDSNVTQMKLKLTKYNSSNIIMSGKIFIRILDFRYLDFQIRNII